MDTLIYLLPAIVFFGVFGTFAGVAIWLDDRENKLGYKQFLKDQQKYLKSWYKEHENDWTT